MMFPSKRGAPLIVMRNTATDTAFAGFCTRALTGLELVPDSQRRRPFVM